MNALMFDSTHATFDQHNWCNIPGWATYHKKHKSWFHPRCWFSHNLPERAPEPADGHSPTCYDKCSRCQSPMKWYLQGQHRYGGVDRNLA